MKHGVIRVVGKLRPHLTYANVTVTLLGFAVLGGGAVAIGGVINSEGEIQACYDKAGRNQGEVRLLVKGKCQRRSEKPIEWSQQGPPGPGGPVGPQGETGAAGPAGTAIVARARFSGDQAGTLIQSPVPLTNASWTQAAGELDHFYGTVTLDIPSTAQCGANHSMAIGIRLGTKPILELELDSDSFATAQTGAVFDLVLPPGTNGAILGPPAATPRTVTASFDDSCTGTRFHLRELQFEVVGVS